MITRALGCVVLIGCLVAGTSVQAHHSTASVYDPGKEESKSRARCPAPVRESARNDNGDGRNDDGTSTDWVFTTGSATALANRGISKVGPNALRIGEELTVTFTPARNGAPLGGLRRVSGRTARFWVTTAAISDRALDWRSLWLLEERMIWTRVAIVAALMISVPSLSSAQAWRRRRAAYTPEPGARI